MFFEKSKEHIIFFKETRFLRTLSLSSQLSKMMFLNNTRFSFDFSKKHTFRDAIGWGREGVGSPDNEILRTSPMEHHKGSAGARGSGDEVLGEGEPQRKQATRVSAFARQR